MNSTQVSVQEVFSRALEIRCAEDLGAFLDESCRGDQQMRQKVESLLAAHADADRFLNGTDYQVATVGLASMSEGPGTRIGPYKIREKIGEGGFGIVFVAEQEQPVCRKVALKIIRPGMDTKDVIARFEAERQALAVMDHPNVAKVLDAGTTASGHPFFAMELVHGVPITEFCDQLRMSNRQRLELFVDVCRAVHHAHQKGIIHRDLKPSNVMVTMHDDTPVPKVIDFGVAKALSQKLTEKTIYTSYGQMIGTPLYMSPEQAQLSGLDVDTRSDVYSLGVLLYELLTGTTPFDRETIRNAGYDEVRRIIREDDPPRPSVRVSTLNANSLATESDRRQVDQRRLSQSLRGELDWIVMKSLEKDRARRYESASKLAEDLKNYLRDDPVEACPPSLGYRCRKFASRNRLTLTTTAVVALALILGTIGSVWQAVRASAAEADAVQQRTTAVVVAQQARASEAAAQRERDTAIAARERLRRVLYASEMNLVEVAWDDNNFRRVSQLLAGTRPQKGELDIRGFEWHYWNRQLQGPAGSRSVAIAEVASRRRLSSELSPNGQLLAAQFEERGVHSVAIWDTTGGQEVCRFELGAQADNPQSQMYFSPDGKKLAVPIFRTGNLRVWDTSTGMQIHNIQDEETVYGVWFNKVGNRLVYSYGAAKEKRAPSDFGYKLWDLDTDKQLFVHRFEGQMHTSFMYLLPHGDRSVMVLRGKDRVPHLQVWNVDTAEVLEDRPFVNDLWFRAISPDGSRFLVHDRTVEDQFQILDARTLETVDVLQSDESVMGVPAVFSPDGKLLAASSDSRRISVWNLRSPQETSDTQPEQARSPVHVIPVARPRVDLGFSSDSRHLSSLINDEVQIWEVSALNSRKRSTAWSSGGIIGGSLSIDCSQAAFRAAPEKFNQSMALINWDVAANREIWRYSDPRGNRSFANPAFNPDGTVIVVPTRQAQTTRWNPAVIVHDELVVLDAKSGQVIRTHKPKAATNIDNMIFDPDGTHVAAIVTRRPSDGDASFHAVLWDLMTGEQSMAFKIEDPHPHLVSFSSDGKELLISQQEGGVLVLDTVTKKRRRIIAPDGTALNRQGRWSLSPDGSTLAVLGLQGRYNEVGVELYDASTGEFDLQIPVHTKYPPLAVTWSPDGRRLALLSSSWTDAEISVWDTDTGRLVLTLRRPGLITSNRRSLRFSEDNHRLLHITSDNRIDRGGWDNPTLHPIHIWDATPLAD